MDRWNVRIYDGVGNLLHNWCEFGESYQEVYEKIKLTPEFMEGENFDLENVDGPTM